MRRYKTPVGPFFKRLVSHGWRVGTECSLSVAVMSGTLMHWDWTIDAFGAHSLRGMFGVAWRALTMLAHIDLQAGGPSRT